MAKEMINGRASVRRPREDANKQFANYTKDILALSHKQAAEFQRDVANQIQRDIIRKGASTRRLQIATAMENNRIVKSDTWRVGIPSELNNSIAKYWRTFEFGSGPGPGQWRRPFVGTVLYGVFTEQRQFVPSSRLSSDATGYSTKGKRYVVKKEIVGQQSYRKAWNNNGWARRQERSFIDVLNKNFGARYKQYPGFDLR